LQFIRCVMEVRSIKNGIIFCTIVALLLILYCGLQNGVKSSYFSYSRGSGNVTILIWYWPFGDMLTLKGNVCWDRYKIPNCLLVDHRSFFPSADVVVFHNRELIQGSQQLPTELPRPQGQRWAWMSLESPAHNGNLKKFANIFNMTISYRRDADVTIPYGELKPLVTESNLVEDSHINKTSLVCWVYCTNGCCGDSGVKHNPHMEASVLDPAITRFDSQSQSQGCHKVRFPAWRPLPSFLSIHYQINATRANKTLGKKKYCKYAIHLQPHNLSLVSEKSSVDAWH
uniref:Fucosyltransferase N-terminal domain-containing protein n=1 Tax=Xiphophorus couchianus TaxID=32473 RepID=A0A3B5L790_9TELE